MSMLIIDDDDVRSYKQRPALVRVDFDHIGLIYRMGFSLWLDIKCSVSRNRFSFLLSLANL